MDAKKCFRSMYADFESQLNPADISASLYSAELLSVPERDEVNNIMLPIHTRVTTLLSAVERAIPSDPQIFSTFLDILEKTPKYKFIASQARTKLGQRPPMQQPSVGVSVGPLKGKIRDADISRIAGDLPQWQIVASKLGMGEVVISDIENNHRGTIDQRMAFLRKWIGRNGDAATYEKLIVALESLDERGAAEKIREIGQA